MLEPAFFHLDSRQLGQLCYDEIRLTNKKVYHNFAGYHDFLMQIDDTQKDNIQMVSLNKFGRVIGYFSSKIYFRYRLSSESFFIKFSHCFETEEDNKVFHEDFIKHIESMLTSNAIDIFSFCTFEEHPANKLGGLYNNIMNLYGGSVVSRKKNFGIIDDKPATVITYEFETIRDKIPNIDNNDSERYSLEELGGII